MGIYSSNFNEGFADELNSTEEELVEATVAAAITGQVLAPAGCCAMIPHIGLYPGISPHHMPHTRVRTMCAPAVSIGIKHNFPPPTTS